MTARFLVATAAVSLLVGSGAGPAAIGTSPAALAQARRTLTPDDLFELHTVGDPHISPDGAWVAYTVASLDRKDDAADTDIWMAPAQGGGGPVRLTSSKKPETSPRWSPNGRYLAFLSARDGRKTQVYLLDRRGGDAVALTSFKSNVSALAWSPDSTRLALVVADVDPDEPADDAAARDKKPKPIVIDRLQFMQDGTGYLNDLRRHIHVFDLATKTDTPITSGPYDDGAPVWSPDGTLLAFSANRTANPDSNDNSDIFVVEPRAGAAVRAVTTSPSSDTSPVFSPDGKTIAYVTGGDPKDLWYATNNVAIVPVVRRQAQGEPEQGRGVAGGTPRVLTAGVDRNVARPQFSADGTHVYFLVEEGGNSHIARVAVAGGTIERVLAGERDVTAFDLARNGDIALLDSQLQRPGEVFLLPASGTTTRSAADAAVRPLTHVNDAFLATVALGPVERFTAKSADGTPIDAFLTRPPNAPAGQRLPTILRIHGGPVSQYSTGFNLEWQMLAAQGFAVVSANPRGSSGYGSNFSRAIFADWGNKDFADVMAAVDQAIAMGVADPDRLGVGGWSYGGILTDHVISRTPRFKAAVSGASEFNYLANYGTDHYQRQWETELGLPWQNTELWMKLSPFYRVDKIITPTLVMGGDADMNVPILGGEQLYQALKRLGRDTELVIYPGEPHSIRRPSFQKDRFERYIAWYSKYLAGTIRH